MPDLFLRKPMTTATLRQWHGSSKERNSERDEEHKERLLND